jgi:mono/diheme cytochrome c family protein
MSRSTIFLALGICGFLGGCVSQPSVAPIQPDVRLIQSVEGRDLFRAYCAPCHGPDADGRGIIAPALKASVPDLRQLTKRNQGQFPEKRIRGVLNGDVSLVSHGSQEMPVWGPLFHQIENDMDWGNVRVANLVKYLQSIQTGPDPSGAELYNQFCSACHGVNLKGSGPAPEPYKSAPDLTTLARRNSGKFPDAHVLDILRNGVVIPAHGLADMPAWGTDSRLMDAANPTQVSARIQELVNFLKSRQAQ